MKQLMAPIIRVSYAYDSLNKFKIIVFFFGENLRISGAPCEPATWQRRTECRLDEVQSPLYTKYVAYTQSKSSTKKIIGKTKSGFGGTASLILPPTSCYQTSCSFLRHTHRMGQRSKIIQSKVLYMATNMHDCSKVRNIKV